MGVAERLAGMAFGDVVHRRCEVRPPAAKRNNGVEETLGREPACTGAEREFDDVERCHDERVIDPEHVEPGDRYPVATPTAIRWA